MGWQTHFSFTFTLTGPFGKCVEEKTALSVKSDIPLDELFAAHFSSEMRELSLNHRKILWTYKNTPRSVWAKAASELCMLINSQPAQAVTVKTSHAGVAVALFMMSESKYRTDKTVHFEFDNAPMAWLEKQFAPVSGAHSVEFIKDPTSVWPHKSRRAA